MSKSTTGRRKAAVRPRPAVEDRTQRFYETRAQEYADTTRRRTLTPLLEDFSKRLPRGRILDLGCGGGYDLGAFRGLGHAACGLDYSEPIAKIAHLNAQAPVVVADMRAIPFRDDSFDGVWASASLLHLPRGDLVTALKEVRRVLRRGGLMFASLKVGVGDLLDADGRFFTFYENADWQERVTAAGFQPLSTTFNQGNRKGSHGRPERWMTSLAAAA
ncbi:class I SAM-dependent methyltransferase [Bradyrhizobium sp. USDA 223]|uniref:class I SAM-dependent methyltransferase n=1 Tax=Bradyrhizobium sp. USDA 223 TaxID=3156306 RepID=UPI00383809C8